MHGRKRKVVSGNGVEHTLSGRFRFSGHGRIHWWAPRGALYASLLLVFGATGLGSISASGSPQTQAQNRFSAGVETDALPLATGGYLAAAWMGTPRVQVRALAARVHIPDLARPDAFDRQEIDAVAVLIDVHPLGASSPWWVAGGLVHWDGRIRDASTRISSDYDVWLVNGSAGWHRDVWKNLYVRPWAGLSLRAGGDRDIRVGNATYDPRLLNPELSVKMGWRFTRE